MRPILGGSGPLLGTFYTLLEPATEGERVLISRKVGFGKTGLRKVGFRKEGFRKVGAGKPGLRKAGLRKPSLVKWDWVKPVYTSRIWQTRFSRSRSG